VSARNKIRCGECGFTESYPDAVTPEVANLYCSICSVHRHHSEEFDYHQRCPICLAREWRGWLRALRLLISNPRVVRVENL
jgi:late competence protein required for DNA uptake (superfamily II DNA/RNA helicase)